MGAGVAELKEQLAAVNVQLATAAESAELLEQKAALEAELKAAQAKKSADSAAAGAYGLFCSCHTRPPAVSPAPSPARPPRLAHLTHNTRYHAQARRPRRCRSRSPRLLSWNAGWGGGCEWREGVDADAA